ncbi:hypothetical protein BJ322DRAFT_1114347 [Thelephora terrestris]|uniref:Uncharacterized protein n=1 Tax=Thelephora terrestris TaxID=56493 RepID=A0A9P6H3E4_9AGAM|nr:hypothetical protein BJ322DRAFT_1114347 [Thelephora terrestris]
MRQQTAGDFVVLSNPTAFAMCDGLLRMSNCLILELPESELREIRYMLDTLLTKADLALDLMEHEISLNFEGLNIEPERRAPPGAEDFGAVLVSATGTTDPSRSNLIGHQDTVSSASAPPPVALSPPPVPPTSPVLDCAPSPATEPGHILPVNQWHHPLVLSSRVNVGFPDYTYHPHFIRPGIPGIYHAAPTPSEYASSGLHCVITKGLYVGIFTDLDEAEPWYLGIPRSFHRQMKSWEEAKDLYNAKLTAGAVQILP